MSSVEFLLGVSTGVPTGEIVGAGHSVDLEVILGAAALLNRRIIGGVDSCETGFLFLGGIVDLCRTIGLNSLN